MTSIKISSSAFNEIASALEKAGRAIGQNTGVITLEKDDKLIDPVDWRGATVRKDCLTAATNLKGADTKNILEISDAMFQFVLHGTTKKEI